MSNIVRVRVIREGRKVVRFRRRRSLARPLPADLLLPMKEGEHFLANRVRRLRADLRRSFLRLRRSGENFRLRRIARGVHRVTWWWERVRRLEWLPAWLLGLMVGKMQRCEEALRDVKLMPLDRWCWRLKCFLARLHAARRVNAG